MGPSLFEEVAEDLLSFMFNFLSFFPGVILTNSTAPSRFILRAESATQIGRPPSAIYGFTALKITVIYSLLH